MKKLLILLSILLSLQGFSQDKIDFKNRQIVSCGTTYAILVKEKFHRGYYRMTLFAEYKYYDCIYSKGKFLYIKQL